MRPGSVGTMAGAWPGPAAFPAEAYRLLADVPHVEVLGLVEEVRVEVRVHPELPCEAEDRVHVGAGIGVVVRAAADEVGTLAESLGQERLRSRRLEDALLGEGAELELEGRGVLFSQRAQRLEPLEPHDGIDLHVAPHGGGAAAHREIEDGAGAGPDIVHREAALCRAGNPDGLGEAALARTALEAASPRRQERLVQVDMGIHEARGDQSAPHVDDARRPRVPRRAPRPPRGPDEKTPIAAAEVRAGAGGGGAGGGGGGRGLAPTTPRA